MKKIYVVRAQDEPSADTKETTIRQETPEEVEEVSKLPVDTTIPVIRETEQITQRNIALDGSITPIDVIENIKLESYVNKTIVNDNNVVDVPLYQEKDQMLEEVRKMISEPPAELTTVAVTSTEATTIRILPETTIDGIITTQYEEITQTTMFPVTVTPAPETETIFVPINTANNENVHVYDDKLSVISTEISRVSVLGLLMRTKRIVNHSCRWTFYDLLFGSIMSRKRFFD